MTQMRLLLTSLFLCAASPALAQEKKPDEGLGIPNPYELQPPDSDEFDRPLARALAFDQRDLVESLILQPSQLGTHDVSKLAEDLAIPRHHAARAIAAAQAGIDVGSRTELLKFGLPETAKVPADAKTLHTLPESKLVEAVGLTRAQAREFISYRQSVQRVALHATEVKIVRDARVGAGRRVAETANSVLQSRGVGRVQAIADALGMTATPESELRELRESRATTVGRTDALAEFRRADGTLDMKRLSAREALSGAGGVAHFAFALFLKELAVVLHTGDARRLDEFVDGLLTTDFYVNYGLFAAGARSADAIYGSYVRRISQKSFMSQVMRSNLVLAAGLAVPMVVRGQFELDTYVVDVAALGLSVTAVKGAVEGTKGLYRLVRGNRAAALRLGKLATPAGWIYTAGETAVVLLLGDYLAGQFDTFMDQRKLRGLVRDSQDDLWKVVQSVQAGKDVAPEEIEAAVAAVEHAYDRLRQYKLDPVQGRLALFQTESGEVARQALRGEVSADAMQKALAANPALAQVIKSQHGSVEAYLERMRAQNATQAENALETQGQQFQSDWNALVRDAYQGQGNDGPTPTADSRLGSYDAQSALLQEVIAAIPADQADARAVIVDAIARTRLGRTMDQNVFRNTGATTEPTPARGDGAIEALREAFEPR